MTRVDALIVGGGPAGLAAGIVLARGGAHTLVCERKHLPADKACGEGVMPSGVAALERLQVTPCLRPGDYFPFKGICYRLPGGQTAVGNFRQGSGWGIPRRTLSSTLLERACALKSLEIREDVKIESCYRNGGRWWVRVEDEWISPTLLVGADGLNSSVRKWAGLDAPLKQWYRWGVRQHFAIAPWSEYVEVHWGDGVEAYVTPCGERLIGVAFLWDRTRYLRLPGGDALIPSLIERFPFLRRQLGNVTPCDAPLALGPMEQNVRGVVADGLLLIGDAAGYLDALTGEGISLALHAALALEPTVLPLLRFARGCGGALSAQALGEYARAHRAIVTPYYRFTRLALWLGCHQKLLNHSIRLLAVCPELFSLLLSYSMGSTFLRPGTVH